MRGSTNAEVMTTDTASALNGKQATLTSTSNAISMTIPGNTGTIQYQRYGNVCVGQIVTVGSSTTGTWNGTVPRSVSGNVYSILRDGNGNIRGGLAVYPNGTFEVSITTQNVALYGSITWITDQ